MAANVTRLYASIAYTTRQQHPPPSLFSLHLSFILATTEGGRGRERTRGNTKEEERGQGISVYRIYPPSHPPLHLSPHSFHPLLRTCQTPALHVQANTEALHIKLNI